MSKLIDRSQEKLELAKEMGLDGYISAKNSEAKALKQAIAKAEAVLELTAMNYKPLTNDSFKFFPKWNWNLKAALKDERSWPLRKVVIAKMRLADWKDELPYGALLAVKEAKERGVEGFEDKQYANLFFSFNYTVDVNGNVVNAPRSIAKPTFSYRIYYPKVEERIKADPIITGMYKGVEVEIFAWDDSKVYE